MPDARSEDPVGFNLCMLQGLLIHEVGPAHKVSLELSSDMIFVADAYRARDIMGRRSGVRLYSLRHDRLQDFWGDLRAAYATHAHPPTRWWVFEPKRVV